MLANKFDRGNVSRMKLSANKPLGHTAEGFSLVNCFTNDLNMLQLIRF